MNDFFVSFQAYRRNYLYWVGSFVVVCSCGLVGIKEAILNKLNESIEKDVDKVDKIIITSLTILDPLTAVQLTDNYTNDVLRIEDEGIVPQNNKIKSKMKILGKILTSAGCMILGYYLILGALAIHPYLGGIVIGIALFAIGDIIRDKY